MRAQLVAWLGFDTLEHPMVLIGLVPAVALLLLASRWRRPDTLPWPALCEAEAASGGRRPIRPAVAVALRALALGCLALVLAGPLASREIAPETGWGLDLALVLDSSASMRALDVQLEHLTRTRLDLAKLVVARFAEHRAAAGDRVALVVFGERAFTRCPLTSDGALLGESLEGVEVGVAGESTALGDALALAVKRLSPSDATRTGLGQHASAPASDRVVVLLTDGRSNAGAVPVSVATELARAADIRVHTVGIGGGGDEIPMAAPSAAIGQPRFERHDPDPETLRSIARQTGGRYFAARSSLDLAEVYAEIDSLERSARDLPPRMHRARRPEPLLALAGACLVAEVLLARVLYRSLP